MINRIILLMVILVLFLFNCSKNDKLLLFDKKNNEIILSKKLIGRNLEIHRMKYNGEALEYLNFDDGESIIIKRTTYNISELDLNSGLYRLNVSYMGRIYYVDILLKDKW